MAIVQTLSIIVAVLASLAAVVYKPLTLRAEVLGINRPLDRIQNTHGEDFGVIADTLYTEDLHHHLPSGLLFGAAEEKVETRWNWFPPMSKFNASHAFDRGSIVVIDPGTRESKTLTLVNFSGPFITHGIDIYSPANDPNSVFIFAVNHLPNPAWVSSKEKIHPQARSQIELFHHEIGSSEAKHLRSIWHPLIRTPNDIYAVDAHSIYVTNDHHYRDGWLRDLEDVGFGLTPWSDIIHLTLSSHKTTSSSSDGISATPTLTKIQNPNGLGHGSHPSEIHINRAAAGVMEIATTTPNNALQITDSIQVPNTIDNPSYFHDPYAKVTGRDASGYVLSGLLRASAFPTRKDPVVVWLVQPASSAVRTVREGYVHRKIFQDDGKTISTASTAVIVAIDPAKNEGKKQGWLFVTGPVSLNAVSCKIDL